MISMRQERISKVLDRIPVPEMGASLVQTLQSVRWFLDAPLPQKVPGGGRVLAVDDEPLNLDILGLYMQQIGVDMMPATQGQQGLEMLRSAGGSVDLIVLDRRMPVMDGIAFLKELRADPLHQDVPVLMQSAAVEPEDIAEAIMAGAWFYLTKPFSRNEFNAALMAGLAVRRQRQQARVLS